MNRLPLAAAMAVLTATFVGCHATSWKVVNGSGNIEREDRALTDFKTVTLAGEGDLIIRQGDTEELIVEADDNLIPHLQSTVSGGELTIQWDHGINARPSKPVKLLLTVKSLEAVTISGSGTLTADDYDGDKLTISISGSAEVRLNHIHTSELTTSISGSGTITASGSTNRYTIKVAGSGEVKAANLKAGEVTVKVAGSGDADVWATDKLNVSIAGSGDVRYKGEPTNIQQTVAGSGSVSRVK